MKKTLAFMVMALALLLTQCKKPSITFPTPSVMTTVSMTITAGPGSKTDITTEGGIVWSAGDRIYVGDGTHYVGYLTLQGTGGDATGKFTGDVTVTPGTYTFHFYYLGNAKDYDDEIKESGSLKAVVDFSSQDIHADGRGNLTNASGQHVGYGKAENVTVGEDDETITVTQQVSMKSKVAIAYFRFTRVADGSDYTSALTLSGEQIYNKMTVNFSGDDFEFSGTKGCIRLAGGHCERYAMLVPPYSTAAETLNFGDGDVTGSTTLANGIEANKFYRIDGSMPIEVEMKPVEFSVAADTKVKFAPGNLYYDADDNECHWKFEANQWDFRTYGGLSSCIDGVYDEDSGTPSGDWGLFGWSTYATNNNWGMHTKELSEGYYEGDFKDWGGNVIGGDPENTWHTLSKDEWSYLLNTDGSSGRTDENRFAKAKVNGVNGLLIFPDGYTGATSDDGINRVNDPDAGYLTNNIPPEKWNSMESSGVVFLPAAGFRSGKELNVVGKEGLYWSNLPEGLLYAYYMGIEGTRVHTSSYYRYCGGSVRLVRSAS